MYKIYCGLLIFIVLFSSSLQEPLFLKKFFEPISYNQNNYQHNNGYHHQHLERSYNQNNRPDRKESDGAKRYRDICRINNGFSACPY